MAAGTIVLVHGTGVRLAGFAGSHANVAAAAREAGIEAPVIGCAWGDALGAEFTGMSLPDPPTGDELARAEQDYARWSFLFSDPLFELDRLTIPDVNAPPAGMAPPGVKPPWRELWDRIAAYQPSEELDLLLDRGGLRAHWPAAWAEVVTAHDVARRAFQQSARELAEASGALARAIVAAMHNQAIAASAPGPSAALRAKLVGRLRVDWDQQVYGLGTVFTRLLSRAATRMLRADRRRYSSGVTLVIGDILLYQSRGNEIRAFIREKIAQADGPVTLVGHSLGGIACVDLLAMADPPPVAHLVTMGSQAPFLYEIGAMTALKAPQELPASFPPWLNVYDRNDFLGFIASRLFPTVEDFEAVSGQPFPDSHSAYLGDVAVWEKVMAFIAR